MTERDDVTGARKPSFSGVEDALRKVADVVPPTPLKPLRFGESMLFCKCESEQPMRAFKLRGATNALLSLPPDARARGVITASTGNHGRALAHAAAPLGFDIHVGDCFEGSLNPELFPAGTHLKQAETMSNDKLAAAHNATPKQIRNQLHKLGIKSHW